jgi:hypothetical protein
MRSPHPQLARLRLPALALIAIWALAGLGVETVRTIREGAGGAGRRGVMFWRMGTPPPARLAELLAPVGALVPPGSVVVFATGTDGGGGDAEFFQGLWAAYLLPRHRVVRLAQPAARTEGEYLAAYGTAIEHPRLVELARLPGGVLYRVLPPP